MPYPRLSSHFYLYRESRPFRFLGLMPLIHALVRHERVTDTWEGGASVLLDITLAQLQTTISSPVPLDDNKTTGCNSPPLHIIVHDKFGMFLFTNSPCPCGARQVIHENCSFVAVRCRLEEVRIMSPHFLHGVSRC